jgi:hypothetical protein
VANPAASSQVAVASQQQQQYGCKEAWIQKHGFPPTSHPERPPSQSHGKAFASSTMSMVANPAASSQVAVARPQQPRQYGHKETWIQKHGFPLTSSPSSGDDDSLQESDIRVEDSTQELRHYGVKQFLVGSASSSSSESSEDLGSLEEESVDETTTQQEDEDNEDETNK